MVRTMMMVLEIRWLAVTMMMTLIMLGAGDGKSKVDLGDVDSGSVYDNGGFDTSGGDKTPCGDGDTKVDCGNYLQPCS